MKTKSLLFSLFVLILLMSNASFAQTVDEFTKTIEDRNKQMVEYMLKGNTEASLSLYTDDAISMPSYEPMHQGIAEIRKANETMAASGWKFESFEPNIVKVIPMGNLITEIGTYNVSMNMGDVSKPMKDKGKYLTIWEKQDDGSLKIKVETWNSDMVPTEMMKMVEQQADLDKR